MDRVPESIVNSWDVEVDGTVESEWTTCITPTAFSWVSTCSGVFLNKLAKLPASFFLQTVFLVHECSLYKFIA